MARFPRNISGSFLKQRIPRNHGRADRPQLALNDAGHGSDPEGRNPILWGLGATLNIELGAFVRSWAVTISARIGGVLLTEDITAYFQPDLRVPRRHFLPGICGVFPLGLPSLDEAAHEEAVTYEVTLVTRNARLESRVSSAFIVRTSSDLRRCPSSEECDFTMLAALNKAGVRVFEDQLDREGGTNAPVSFFFHQLDLLVARVGAASWLNLFPDYDPDATVGIEFSNEEGACGPQGIDPISGCAGVPCCCYTSSDFINESYTNITAGGGAIAAGSTVQINEVIEITVTIRFVGSVGCLPFDNLIITLPGVDTTGGRWTLFDPGIPGGFTPTVAVDGTPVSPSFRQDGLAGFQGSGNSAEILFDSVPVPCGSELQIVFRAYPSLVSQTSVSSIGPLTIANPNGACFPDPSVDPYSMNGFVVDPGPEPPPKEPSPFNNVDAWNESEAWGEG